MVNMKVALITPYSPRLVTGAGTYVSDHCRELAKNNNDYFVITPSNPKQPALPEIFTINENFFEVKTRKFPFLANLFFLFGILKLLLKKRDNYQIIHCFSLSFVSGACVIIARIVNKPVVTTIFAKLPGKTSLFKKLIYDFFIWLTLTYSDVLAFETKEARSSYDAPRGSIVPGGMDPVVFRPNKKVRINQRKRFGIDKGEFVLLYTGRLVESKGLLDLIDAYIILKKRFKKGFRLVLIGEFESAKVKSCIDKIKRDDRFILRSPVPRAAIRNYYNMADAFVLPSYWEGISSALMEAMACGLVPVVTNVGGNVEIIEHNINGLVVPPRQPKDLAKAVARLIRNKKTRLKLARLARYTIVNNFNLQKKSEKYFDIYYQLLDREEE